ncbi:hypothetical protein SKAU_G00182010 [Synaphobranchus kaupii]|uniref:Uncharacterized protein n=1 Tax=Synaphobranchus kaupii TaxID=118154 RepID=A0A9Q1FBX6_SYNKA|nr:hypothetical protein SKAU_G00182010 [Synaphobranchus kaupii]
MDQPKLKEPLEVHLPGGAADEGPAAQKRPLRPRRLINAAAVTSLHGNPGRGPAEDGFGTALPCQAAMDNGHTSHVGRSGAKRTRGVQHPASAEALRINTFNLPPRSPLTRAPFLRSNELVSTFSAGVIKAFPLTTKSRNLWG